MTYSEKVIKGLEHCDFGSSGTCYEIECPYYQSYDCTDELKNDILVLLKGQEAVEPTLYEKGVSLMEKTSEMLSVADVQRKLGLSRQGAYNLVNRPDFPLVRAGKKLLIPIKAFDEWMQKGGTRRENKKQDQ
jgi:predicted DNA-binding transcriptional regulator AlpA